MDRQLALITGASSGIGLEFARLAARDGYDLALAARSLDKLSALADELKREYGANCTVLESDLMRSDAPGEISARLASARMVPDILINNAGFGDRGTVAELSLQRQIDMVHVNVIAVTALTRLLLPGMLEKKHGAILNVASTAAFQPGPHMAVYYATKAYVLSFTEGLHEELRNTGVSVTCLCPGPTATGFAAVAHMENAWLFRLGAMAARPVAEAGWAGLKRGKALVIPGWPNKLGAFSVRFGPRAMVRKLTSALQASR
jgi:uncharacterized protein